jgi:hypothetical protein
MARPRTESASASLSSGPLEEITASAFSGVLRALEARKVPLNKFPGPILVGIIAWPELQGGEFLRQAGGQTRGG